MVDLGVQFYDEFLKMQTLSLAINVNNKAWPVQNVDDGRAYV